MNELESRAQASAYLRALANSVEKGEARSFYLYDSDHIYIYAPDLKVGSNPPNCPLRVVDKEV